MTNHGKLFEDKLAKALITLNLPYNREGSKRSYGARGSNKGKFDFFVNNRIAIECKSIDRASNLRLPWPGLTNTAIKSHQLKALRAEHDKGNIAGLLIEVRQAECMFWLDIPALDQVVKHFGMASSLSMELLNIYADRIKDLVRFLEGLNNDS